MVDRTETPLAMVRQTETMEKMNASLADRLTKALAEAAALVGRDT
jgi:hypothetical protein